MKKRYSAFVLAIACLITAVAAFALCNTLITNKFGGKEAFGYASKFSTIYNTIEKDFVGEVDGALVAESAYRYMFAGIDDRWSYYMNPQEYQRYQTFQENNYTGIGITVAKDKDSSFASVAKLEKGFPAELAGVKIGDLLISIDGESLEGLSSTKISELISAKAGKEFELTLEDKAGARRSVKVAITTVFINPVEHEMLPENIGYIKLKNFEEKSASGAIAALDELLDQGAKGIIIDVRNNGGGFVGEMTAILDHILPEGDIFVSVDSQGKETVTGSDAQCLEIPLVVLVNDKSFSAAEFFAAALSEYDYAEIVGIPTTGKSRSQVTMKLSDGSAIHLSTNGYLTPKRVDLAAQGGLKPDIEVSISEEHAAMLAGGTLAHDADEQLLRAILGIKNQIK